MGKLVDTKEAARIFGVTPRAIRKWFKTGRLKGEIKKAWRKKDKLFIWVENEIQNSGSKIQHNEIQIEEKTFKDEENICNLGVSVGTRRVYRGEPGANIVTPIINGEPVIWPNGIPTASEPGEKNETENLPATTVSPNIIALSNKDNKVVSEKAMKVANLRFALIKKFNEELERKDPNLPLFKNGNKPSKTKKIQKFLELYNSGSFLPDIFSEIKEISRSTLYNWLRLYDQAGLNGLIPAYGNQSAFKKITAAEQQFLRQYLLNQNKPKIQDAIRKCKYILGEKSPSSPATLRRYVNWFKNEYHDVWTLEREGQKAWNDKVAPYATRAWWTLRVGEILVGDGHKLNFKVINPHTGKPCRATLIMFWDWYSSYPVGWEVMLTENVQCVATALRNSIIELGRTPDNVYLDNGKAFRAKCFTKGVVLEESEIPGMFARLGINVIWAMKYNAQAKPVERIFGVLEWLEREIPSYVGANIGDKPANMLPNEPRAKKLRGDFTPKLEQVNDLIRQWRDFYVVQPLRGRQGKTARELFDPGRGPGVDPKALCYLMMKGEVKGVRRGRLTFNGYDYTGECLYGIRPQKVFVRYSLSDRSQIYVFDMQERFLGVVTPVEATAPRDHEAARRIVSERRRLLRQTKMLGNLAKTASSETIDLALKREPALVDFIQKEEAKKYPEKITPFVKGQEQVEVQSLESGEDKDKIQDPNERPFFYTDYDKFVWLMKQPFIGPEDQAYLDDLMERTPIYKEAIKDYRGDI